MVEKFIGTVALLFSVLLTACAGYCAFTGWIDQNTGLLLVSVGFILTDISAIKLAWVCLMQ